MKAEELKSWRKGLHLTQEKLSQMLGVHRVTIAKWEAGDRGIPSFLPLALEALEHRMEKGGKNGLIGGVPGVQKAK